MKPLDSHRIAALASAKSPGERSARLAVSGCFDTSTPAIPTTQSPDADEDRERDEWVLVPLEATESMEDAAWQTGDMLSPSAARVWTAMLAAALAPGAPQ